MPLADLRTIPEPVTRAQETLDRLDEAFVSGFGRLASDHLATLASLQRSFHGTPLGPGLAEAVAGLQRAEFMERHFLVLATARCAVYGAMHDALLAQACAALGRPRPEIEAIAAAPAQAAPPQVQVLLESARHWLMELAIAGFANLDVNVLVPFQATLDAIEGERSLVRHAALLGGFLDELMAVFPAQGTPEVPRLRWADLWSRAMVLCAAPPEPPPTRLVTGEVRPLGTDLRQHSNLASLVVYAALHEDGQAPRLVRTHLAAFKVDVIQGGELGALFQDVGRNLLTALAGGERLLIQGMPLSGTSDLFWDDARARAGGKAYSPAETAALLAQPPALRPCLMPADRHPALIDELVHLPAGAPPLELDLVRMAGNPKALSGARSLVALLRFDGGQWALQPIAADPGKPPVVMAGAAFVGKSDTLATLKERASKLLRKKS